MQKYIALSAQGLEDFVITEVLENKANFIKKYNGIILFESDKKLSNIKTTNDILFLIRKLAGITRYRKSLKNIRQQILKSNFKKKNKDIKSFSVNTSYIGRKDYSAKEINKIVSESLIKKFGWKNVENGFGNIHIHVNLRVDISFIGISIEKKPLHIIRKLKTIPGSLKNSVACAMLKLAEISKNEILLDPMCGSGVIPIEANLSGIKTIGGDINKENIEIANKNNTIKKTNVEFHVWDSTRTNLQDNYIDKIVCNLPFDKQVKIQGIDFFNKFINEMGRISKNDSIWVFLTRQGEIIKKIIDSKKDLKLEKSIKIINSGLESEILVIKYQ